MSRQRYERWMVAGLIATVIIFAGHFLLPDRRVHVHPLENNLRGLYGFYGNETGMSASWADEPNDEWLCDYKKSHDYGCGWAVYTDPEFVQGMDLSAFDAIEISLDYDGPADRIRLFMSNFEPAFSRPDDVTSTKFQAMTFSVREVDEPVLIGLDEFSVADWWLHDRRIRRQWALPAFHNIVRIGVDFIQPGRHQVRVNKIVLVGPWIRTVPLMYGILSAWALLFIGEGAVRYGYALVKRRRERRMIIQTEARKAGQEEERQRLAVLTEVDPLTGLYNRNGLTGQLQALFDNTVHADVGVLMIDLDHFRQLNDRWGYDMGDKALKAYAAALAASLRADDLQARWGGEVFVVICRNQTEATLRVFAEKLRKMAANYRFGGELNLTLTISVGFTIGQAGETFDEAFQRADRAVHLAKQRGRNRVEFVSAAPPDESGGPQ